MLRVFRPRSTHLRQGFGGQAVVKIPATFLEGRAEGLERGKPGMAGIEVRVSNMDGQDTQDKRR